MYNHKIELLQKQDPTISGGVNSPSKSSEYTPADEQSSQPPLRRGHSSPHGHPYISTDTELALVLFAPKVQSKNILLPQKHYNIDFFIYTNF